MMYTGTYGLEEGFELTTERPHKIKWCSVVSVGFGGVMLLGIAYYLVSLASMQRLAYICVTLAGLTIMSCFVGLVFLVSGRPPRSSRSNSNNISDYKYSHYQDSPPKYRESWRKAYLTNRKEDNTDNSQPNPSSSSSSFLPRASFFLKRSSTPIPPPVPHSKSHPSSSLPTTHLTQPRIKCKVDLHAPPSQASSEDELPSYDVAVEVMDAESLRKVVEDVASEE